MDKSAISDLIRSLTSETSPHAVAVRERLLQLHPDRRGILAEHYLAESLEELLKRQPEFPAGRGYMLWYGTGGSGFHCGEAARSLLTYVRDGGSAEAAVEWLDRLLHTTSADCLYIVALWGVTCSINIDLARGFSLTPFSDLPDSKIKDWIIQSASEGVTNPLVPHFFRSAPPCALVKKTRISPLLTPADQEDWPVAKEAQSLVEDANNVRLPLSCLGPSSPTVAATWVQFIDPDIARAAFYGGVQTQPIDVLPAFLLEPINLTDRNPATVVDDFLKTSGAVRGRLEVALNRLNRAVRSHRTADQALDLAIALETLLTDGNPGENTYKISLRAGLLDTGSPRDRQRSRAIAGALYTIRSAVVHSGQVPERVKLGDVGKRPAHEIVTAALQLVATLTRRVILQGRLPHWYTYELGIPDP